jgi:hypothetical protein
MKKFKELKTYCVCMAIFGVVMSMLTGCGGGGGGQWNAPKDTVSPKVTSTAPANAAVGVFTNAKIITATFSEKMDQATISGTTFTVRDNTAALPVSGAVSYNGVTAVFTATVDLTASHNYTATITTGAKDLAGNALAADYVWSFDTGILTDGTAPMVTATINADGATGVPVNTKVGATFSEPMDPATIIPANFTFMQGATNIPGTLVYTGVNLVFTPTSPLAAGTLYTATITTGAKDLAGNAMAANYVWSWTTGAAADITRPRVAATINANGAINVPLNTKVGATFTEAMDPLTITTATFSFKRGLIDVPGTLVYSGLNLVFTPTSPLISGTLYTATITTGAKDLAGNALAGNQAPLPAASDYIWSWTAGAADITPPTITLTAPANAAGSVALNSSVNATFSEAMDATTITNLTFTLDAPGPIPVLGLVTYDAITKIATFKPSANLAASTTYTATVSIAAKDLAGNPLAAGAVPNPWTFTTGSGLAPGAIVLGSASTFGIMATSAITSTGNSVINGDVSLDPGTSMTGFPPGVVNGSIHINDTASALARADLLTAYNSAKTLPPGTGPNALGAGADPGALFPSGVPPGTYTTGSTIIATTPMILDAGGNADAVWVFQIGSSLTTGASVSLANGAQAKNVFWVPTDDATIGVGTIFYGTIVSGRDVTAVTGATINGRILAGAITAGTIALQNATVNVPAP